MKILAGVAALSITTLSLLAACSDGSKQAAIASAQYEVTCYNGGVVIYKARANKVVTAKSNTHHSVTNLETGNTDDVPAASCIVTKLKG